MTIILSIATAMLLIVTLLPMWRNPYWLIRSMEFARLQFAALGLALLVALVRLLDTHPALALALIVATTFCLGWQLWWIIPYTRLMPREVLDAIYAPPEQCLRVLTANVLVTNRNAKPLLELVQKHKPDVLATLESDQWWQDQLDVLETDMPHTLKCAESNGYGMHVYSRLPLSDTEITYLVEPGKPSMHMLTTLRSGQQVRMHFIHPAPPSPTENPESTERDAELVILARKVAESDQPIIVTGDFNDVAWSVTTRLFRKISKLLDPRVGRGIFNTFHAKYLFLRWPLDYIFHSRHFTLVSMQRLPPFGSDHFALLTELALTPEHAGVQKGLEADAGDHEHGDEIITEAKVNANHVPAPGM